MTKSVYFSHPLLTYNTPESLQVYRALQRTFPDSEIVDPEEYPQEKTGFRPTCRDCMNDRMKAVLFPLIDKCEKLAVWPIQNTCSLKCELHFAWAQGKELLHIEYILSENEIELEDLTLGEYHMTEQVLEAI